MLSAGSRKLFVVSDRPRASDAVDKLRGPSPDASWAAWTQRHTNGWLAGERTILLRHPRRVCFCAVLARRLGRLRLARRVHACAGAGARRPCWPAGWLQRHAPGNVSAGGGAPLPRLGKGGRSVRWLGKPPRSGGSGVVPRCHAAGRSVVAQHVPALRASGLGGPRHRGFLRPCPCQRLSPGHRAQRNATTPTTTRHCCQRRRRGGASNAARTSTPGVTTPARRGEKPGARGVPHLAIDLAGNEADRRHGGFGRHRAGPSPFRRSPVARRPSLLAGVPDPRTRQCSAVLAHAARCTGVWGARGCELIIRRS